MRFSSVQGNSIKLDGGSMFGNAPKALWGKWISPDSQNRIDLATRALLVETENSRILFEAGAGAWMKPDLRERYGIQEDHNVLLSSLNSLGLNHHDITDVIISHLHFDHSGGLLTDGRENRAMELLFPNARFIVSKANWERSVSPHRRDKASFIPLLNNLLLESGRLVLVDDDRKIFFERLEVNLRQFNGHTPGMICSHLKWDRGEMIFGADLVPGIPWIRQTITMGYDRFPELLIDEKTLMLSDAAEYGRWIFFTHDSNTSIAKIKKNDQEFVVIDEKVCFTREFF